MAPVTVPDSELKRIKDERDELLAALEAILEDHARYDTAPNDPNDGFCICCVEMAQDGHKDECPVAAARQLVLKVRGGK